MASQSTTTHYTAIFSDGTAIKRRTQRTYSHAWKLTFEGFDNSGLKTKTGFARTEELAKKARLAEAPSTFDHRLRRWKSNPERVVSFEVTPVVAAAKGSAS